MYESTGISSELIVGPRSMYWIFSKLLMFSAVFPRGLGCCQTAGRAGLRRNIRTSVCRRRRSFLVAEALGRWRG